MTSPPDSSAAVPERSVENARRLLAVLEQERAALDHGDAAALEACVAEKGRLLDEIERLGRAVPAAPELRGLLERCAERNRLNGRIIELSRRRVQQALALLRGQSAGGELYGPAGTASASSGARPLAKA
jgi:flagella synthesis protein FlgN